uniref:Gamma-tubulin complex component n=1 Tax=Globodera pallida TaxID=36090 RepID=A0A183BVE7_GLOPA
MAMTDDVNRIPVMSELYLALQGEQCYFTTPSVHNQEFLIKNVNIDPWGGQQISIEFEERLKTIVALSSCVKVIETWKWKQSADSLDSVKKAILESIIGDYNIYQTMADRMRFEHATHRREDTVGDLFAFARKWRHRLQYLRRLLDKSDEICGVRLMNILFAEWTHNCCIRDWCYSLLEKALRAGSAVMHKLCVAWLLDGKLLEPTRWFIRLICPGLDESRRKSCNSLQSSFNTINNSSMIEPIFAAVSSPHQPLAMELVKYRLILPVLLDNEVAPASFYGCPELLDLILDIGRKVHFLKVLRSTRFYDYALDVRRKLLDQLPPNVWCTPCEIGKLAIVVHQLHALISKDMMQELMGKQRLMDHLTLVHGYFFMLRGDLLSALEQTIFIKTAKPTTKSCTTPFSSRRNFSHSAKIAEKCVNDALTMCAPLSNVADLMHCLSGERLKTDKAKGKQFSESFLLTFVFSKCQIDGSREFSAVSEFFTRMALKTYKCVFSTVSNLQLQRSQLDYTAQRFLHNAGRQLAARIEFRPF